MSALSKLRFVGWKGKAEYASRTYDILMSLQELSRHLDFKISGSFALHLYSEHYTNDAPFYNDIDIFVSYDECDTVITNAINDTFYENELIEKNELYNWVSESTNVGFVSDENKFMSFLNLAYAKSSSAKRMHFISSKYKVDDTLILNVIKVQNINTFHKGFDFTICSVLLQFNKYEGNSCIEYYPNTDTEFNHLSEDLSYTFNVDVETQNHIKNKLLVPTEHTLSSYNNNVTCTDLAYLLCGESRKLGNDSKKHFIILQSRFRKYMKRGYSVENTSIKESLQNSIEEQIEILNSALKKIKSIHQVSQ